MRGNHPSEGNADTRHLPLSCRHGVQYPGRTPSRGNASEGDGESGPTSRGLRQTVQERSPSSPSSLTTHGRQEIAHARHGRSLTSYIGRRSNPARERPASSYRAPVSRRLSSSSFSDSCIARRGPRPSVLSLVGLTDPVLPWGSAVDRAACRLPAKRRQQLPRPSEETCGATESSTWPIEMSLFGESWGSYVLADSSTSSSATASRSLLDGRAS